VRVNLLSDLLFSNVLVFFRYGTIVAV